MKIFPAIDIINGKAVRLFKGDYDKMTVYAENPLDIVGDFKEQGAKFLHLVDLDGAKSGETTNIDTVKKIVGESQMFVEVGGGIRSREVIEKYKEIGVKRVILGTVAVTNLEFLESITKEFGDLIAVGVDIKDGYVAIKGWTEKSLYQYRDFCDILSKIGVKTLIVTDISKDGAMKGTNLELYQDLKNNYDFDVIASGGVSSISDVKKLAEIGVYGAIIGKAYYEKAIHLQEAIEVANDNETNYPLFRR